LHKYSKSYITGCVIRKVQK